MSFPKKYNVATEKDVVDLRVENGCYDVQKKSDIIAYSMPLSLGSHLHMGQAFSCVLQDIIFKHKKKLGDRVTWRMGFHQASFAMHKRFIDLSNDPKASKMTYYDHYTDVYERYTSVVNTLKRLGMFFNEHCKHVSFFENVSSKVRVLFEEYYKKSLIYKSKEIVYWNMQYQTLIGKDDIRFEKEERDIFRIKYFVDTKKDCMVIATHRPDTIFADVALAVNPMDKRYKKFVGKKVIIPIINKAIPMIADERIDMTKDNGVFRITPGHDLMSLEIAKDHNLPLDQYAIDRDGKFTELAGVFGGQNVTEFFGNIVQYLDDISNLEGLSPGEVSIPYCMKTGLQLESLAMDQWFLKVSQASVDTLSDMLAFDEMKIFPGDYKLLLENLLTKDLALCISRQYRTASLLPIAEDKKGNAHILNTQLLVDNFKGTSGTKDTLALSLIIFHLFWDGRIQRKFTRDELIDVLFSPSFSDATKCNLEIYSNLILKDTKLTAPIKKEFDQLLHIAKGARLKKLKQNKKNDLEVAEFLDILDESFYIEVAGDNCALSLRNYEEGDLSFVTHGFDSSFFVALSQILGKEGDFDKLASHVMLGSDNLQLFVQSLLLSIELHKKSPFDLIAFHKVVMGKRGQKMGLDEDELIFLPAFLEEYGADAVRLSLAEYSYDSEEKLPDMSRMGYYKRILNKLWNAARYIKTQSLGVDGDAQIKFNYSDIQTSLETYVHDFGTFDLWILHVFNDFMDEWRDGLSLQDLPRYVKKCIAFVEEEFCDWYLEISKLNNGAYSEKLLLWTMGTLLKLLHPLIPNITEQLRQNLGFEGFLIDQVCQAPIQLAGKNYKIHLYMNIIKKLLAMKTDLGAQKHESVSVFVQATSDFLDEIASYEDILKKLLNCDEVIYVKKHEEPPLGFEVDQVIDIMLGVKKHEVVTKKDQMQELMAQIEQKKEYLQYLRTIVSGAAASGRHEIVAEKESQIAELKSDIEKLETDLIKMKVD